MDYFKWIANSILWFIRQIFNKIFLGPIALASYSVPQQLTGKLSIISKSLRFLLPNLSRKTNNYEFDFS